MKLCPMDCRIEDVWEVGAGGSIIPRNFLYTSLIMLHRIEWEMKKSGANGYSQ